MRIFWRLIVFLALMPIQSYTQNMERAKANIIASHEVLINVPIDMVWKALAIDYGDIGKWASGVNHVIESSGQGITATRSCEINAAGFNDTKEKVITFEPDQHYFEYELYEGLPKFVDYSINKDKLIKKGEQTLWISTNEMYVKGIMGASMKGFMTKKLNDVLKGKADEFKHYIEKRKPHPNKLRAKAKLENKELFVVEQLIEAPISEVWKVLVDDFAKVSDSSQLSPRSEFADGHQEVKVGARRIMYKSKNLKKYFKDEITLIDDENHNFSIEVIEAKGYPNTFTTLDFDASVFSPNQTQLAITFTYKTKPKFLQKLIKRSLEKDLKNYLYAIDYHVKTKEIVNDENWEVIKKQYQ